MHLTKLPSGTWRVSVRHNGRRATATAPTRSAAQHLGAELLLEMGGTTRNRNVTVDDLLGNWLATVPLSITYRADAQRVIDRLPVEFTARRLLDVSPSVIEGLYRQLARDGWSAHRIGRVHAVLSSAFTLARRYEWVAVNPFTAARRPHTPATTIHPPSAVEVERLISAADDRFRLYVAVSAELGARRGEVVGLQWQDVSDLSVIVRRSLSYAPKVGVQVTEGKSGPKGHRVVAIDGVLSSALKAHRLEQVEMALASGLPNPVWVFSHDAGITPWRPDFASREFRRLRRTLGLPDTIRLHDLRHFVATQLLAGGIPLKTVSARLGHRQMATTADTYAHYVPAADRDAATLIAGILKNTSVNSS